MNQYQVTTSAGVIKFEACDSDFAVWKANQINRIGLGNTERVDLVLVVSDDNHHNCGQFDLVGSQNLITETFFIEDELYCVMFKQDSNEVQPESIYTCQEVETDEVITKSHSEIVNLILAGVTQ